jgi:hypothetical protein
MDNAGVTSKKLAKIIRPVIFALGSVNAAKSLTIL